MKRFLVVILCFQSLGMFSQGIDSRGMVSPRMVSPRMVSQELNSTSFCEPILTTCEPILTNSKLAVDSSNVTVDLSSTIQTTDTTKPSDSNENVYRGFVDVQATYPGGTDAFYRYLSSNLRYPERCREEGLTGQVVIRFVVDKTGNISQISPLKDVKNCPEFTNEAIRVIRMSKRWIPAQQNGRFVSSWMQIPVRFDM